MLCTVIIYIFYCFIYIFYKFEGHYHIKILCTKIFFICRLHIIPVYNMKGFFAISELHTAFYKHICKLRQYSISNILMNQYCFYGITCTWPLSFCIFYNRQYIVHFCTFIYKYMAHSCSCFNNGNCSIFNNKFFQSFSASRYEDINILIHFYHFIYKCPVSIFYKLN